MVYFFRFLACFNIIYGVSGRRRSKLFDSLMLHLVKGFRHYRLVGTAFNEDLAVIKVFSIQRLRTL
jgi:hypothetical protein